MNMKKSKKPSQSSRLKLQYVGDIKVKREKNNNNNSKKNVSKNLKTMQRAWARPSTIILGQYVTGHPRLLIFKRI